MLTQIITNVALSPSLMAVHLDGNPGLNKDFIQFTHEKLKTRNPYEQINSIPHPQVEKVDLDPNTMQETLLLKSI